MNRRQFNKQIAAGAAVAMAPSLAHAHASPPGIAEPAAETALAQQDPMMKVMTRFVDDLSEGDAKVREMIAPSKPRQIAMIAYPGMFPLDLLGPLTIFSDLLNTQVHLVWKDRTPVAAGRGVSLTPIPFADVPPNLDVLFLPGGTMGTMSAMRNDELLTFLRGRADSTRYITSVCTGSLILGAAGLLKGYKATSHWLTHALLSEFGATPVQQRVVEDRNRITGAGVTAGLDFALTITARLAGTNYAKAEQLNVEYDPAPPFNAGTQQGAGPVVAGAMRRMYESSLEGFRATTRAAVAKLG